MCNFQFYCWSVWGCQRANAGGFSPYQVLLPCNQLIIMARLFWHMLPRGTGSVPVDILQLRRALRDLCSAGLLDLWIHKLQLIHSVWQHVEEEFPFLCMMLSSHFHPLSLSEVLVTHIFGPWHHGGSALWFFPCKLSRQKLELAVC